MPVEERRRVALHRQIAAAFGEEAADTLFELITPAGHELATRQDIDDLRAEMQRGFEQVDQRFSSFEERMDARFRAMDERFDGRITSLEERFEGRFATLEERADGRAAALGERFERRIADAVTTQTRTMVLSQLAALVTIAALAFGLR